MVLGVTSPPAAAGADAGAASAAGAAGAGAAAAGADFLAAFWDSFLAKLTYYW